MSNVLKMTETQRVGCQMESNLLITNFPLSPQRKAAFRLLFFVEREGSSSRVATSLFRAVATWRRRQSLPSAFMAAFLAFERVWMRIPRIVESGFPLFLYSLIFVVPLHQNTEIHSSDFSIVLISMLISF